MDVTVIICTYNRCRSLQQTLQSFCDLEIPRGMTWELLVVDNNSDDATREVCEFFASKLPMRYSFEPIQGQSRARNRGAAEASSPLLVFTDDDVKADKNWLASLWQAARLHPEIDIFGGRILPLWERTPPSWLAENATSMLRLICTHFDLGDEERVFVDCNAGPWGANMAFRRSVLTDQFRFLVDLGITGRDNVRGEETDLICRLLKGGHQGLYVPEAMVYHRNTPERATERYVFAYYKGAGMTEMRLRGPFSVGRLWFGVPRYLWLKVIKHFFQYVIFRPTRPSQIWLRAEIDLATNWGRIIELRRLTNRGGAVGTRLPRGVRTVATDSRTSSPQPA
ncbi:MAG TPA: glycosyltransferase [Verrucomicrobiae bacterium]|nr:glycosyltransferase [Verrucomicrobiae bacterium]